MNRWQDVIEEIYGGGEPEKAPVIIEKVKPDPSIEYYAAGYPLKEKRKGGFRPPSIEFMLVLRVTCLIMGILLCLWAAFSVNVKIDTRQCAEMMNDALKDLPARCLAELSKVTPR